MRRGLRSIPGKPSILSVESRSVNSADRRSVIRKLFGIPEQSKASISVHPFGRYHPSRGEFVTTGNNFKFDLVSYSCIATNIHRMAFSEQRAKAKC